MTRALIAGGIALALMGLAVHNPNLRTIQRRIIALRAAWSQQPIVPAAIGPRCSDALLLTFMKRGGDPETC